MNDAATVSAQPRAAPGWPAGRQPIHLPLETRPILCVVIDTEGEFEWSKPHERQATSVEHMRHIGRAQALFDEFGIVPNYVVDYPTASQPLAVEALKPIADATRALTLAHLHPSVSPPHDEEVNAFNSYPGNLPGTLEEAKRRLTTTLLVDGVRVFVFSFHSPSVMPGGTPYVRSPADLERFVGRCRRCFEFSFRRVGGVAMTPLEILERLGQRTSAEAGRG